MKFLLDNSPDKIARAMQRHERLIHGQLITPLTRYRNHGKAFAIDNGAFSRFDARSFQSLLDREEPNRERCLFVTVPDIVGSGRRTLELWRHRRAFVQDWPLALVAQDGLEELDIPWSDLSALFVGGRDPWKDSQAAIDIVRTAKTLGKWVHVGRVNTERRFKLFAEAGADSCDGSGIAMYDEMMDVLARRLADCQPSLFEAGTAVTPVGADAMEVHND